MLRKYCTNLLLNLVLEYSLISFQITVIIFIAKSIYVLQ